MRPARFTDGGPVEAVTRLDECTFETGDSICTIITLFKRSIEALATLI
jgi:hypothetical protein